MDPHLFIMTALALALSWPPPLVATEAQTPRATSSAGPACWPGEPEIRNTNVGNHRTPALPRALKTAKVQRYVMFLKLCVSKTGEVVRVLVVGSSGNVDVDAYYVNELSKWKVAPAEQNSQAVRSVVPLMINLHFK